MLTSAQRDYGTTDNGPRMRGCKEMLRPRSHECGYREMDADRLASGPYQRRADARAARPYQRGADGLTRGADRSASGPYQRGADGLTRGADRLASGPYQRRADGLTRGADRLASGPYQQSADARAARPYQQSVDGSDHGRWVIFLPFLYLLFTQIPFCGGRARVLSRTSPGLDHGIRRREFPPRES